MRTRLLAFAALLAGVPAVSFGSWLSNITGIDINVPAGTVSVSRPNPAAIPEMLRNLPNDVRQFVTNPLGSATATAIRHAAAQARHGARPMPPEIRAILSPYSPAAILNRALWNTYDPNRITLDSAMLSMQNELTRVGAITLDNVIVFYEGSQGQNNWKLWAHELVHVMQYDNMGVEGFADTYTAGGWNQLENQAYNYADHVERLVIQQRATGNAPQWNVNYSNAGGRQLSHQQFVEAAKQVYPAHNCASWVTIWGGAQITNTCGVPIRITGWTQINPYTGYPYPGAATCSWNCEVGPGQSKPFSSNVPGMWSNVFFAY
jgi:Domain of unknown function (DUF4157)